MEQGPAAMERATRARDPAARSMARPSASDGLVEPALPLVELAQVA